MLWLLDNWAPVLSDFSVFHGKSRADVETLPAPELFDLALLLLFYTGAVQATAMRAFRAAEQQPQAPRQIESTRAPSAPEDPTPDQVRAMRDAARRKKFGPKFGEHKYVGLDEFMGVVGGG